MSETARGGFRAWLRTPAGFAVVGFVVVAVFLAVRWRGGGEAGAAFGAQDQDAIDCVAVYPDGLGEADFAFDGVVTGTGPSVSDRPDADLDYTGVTFEVREWFEGGDVDTVTVDLSSRPSRGARLLVAGAARWGGDPLDAPVGWDGCGFVRYFDPTLATTWRTTF